MYANDDLWERIKKLEIALELADEQKFKMRCRIGTLERTLAYHAGTTVAHAIEQYKQFQEAEDEAQQRNDNR